MIQFILVIFAILFVSANLHIRAEKLVPVTIICVAVCTYSFGIVSNLNIAFVATIFMLFFVIVASCFIGDKLRYSDNSILEKDSFLNRLKPVLRDVCTYGITPQVLIYACIFVLISYLYSAHMVIDWDDLNAWAIYSKNLYFLNRLPLGVENCSIRYKDYQPIQQIMQYFFMKGADSFKEPRLFVTNVGFLYAMCLPVLDGLKTGNNKATNRIVDISFSDRMISIVRNVVIVAIYILLPNSFTTQFYHRLGIDYLISVVFGIGIYQIYMIQKERIDSKIISGNGFSSDDFSFVLSHFTLVSCMTYLTLVKSSGIVLTIFLIVIYLVCRNWNTTISKNVIQPLVICGTPMIYYLSWKWFTRRTNNHGYLSDKIDSNIEHRVLNFPSYTKDVVLHYFRSFKDTVLTRQDRGMTVLIAIIMIAVLFVIFRQELNKRLLIPIMLCFFAFCLGHIYMYLFVFDEWEAIPLLEFDRYICQYLGGIIVFAIILMTKQLNSYSIVSSEVIAKSIVLPGCILILFIYLFPYEGAKQFLGPDNYMKTANEMAGNDMKNGLYEYELSSIDKLNLPVDDNNKILLVADMFDDSVHFFIYKSVPHAYANYANVPAVEEENLNRFVRGQIENCGIKYVYVLSNAADSFQGDFAEESKELTSDGKSVSQGWYEVQPDLSMKRIEWSINN